MQVGYFCPQQFCKVWFEKQDYSTAESLHNIINFLQITYIIGRWGGKGWSSI